MAGTALICQGLSREKSNDLYREVLADRDEKAMRQLCTEDLFFLLTIGCKRADINRDWLYDRCREVEASPDGNLDLWAREHYKSTIITFGQSIRDILNNPDVTIGIFSHTRPIAKGFLDQIKREFEANTFLKSLFPDVLYDRPQSEAPKWSLDSGLIVKRKTNPKESTVEAWGLVDGQPTGKHFKVLNYDDVVTRESVTTPDQIKKTMAALELSFSLGSEGGCRRFIGTRYHQQDAYGTLIKRGSVVSRVHPARKDGKIDGEPAFLSEETLREKRRDFGPYTFACQMLQDPVADRAMGFKPEWLKFYKKRPELTGSNLYIVVDPASKKKSTSDYTVMMVIALASDNNYYVIDIVRDRLNLTQRAEKLFELHRKYKPKKVGYEEYGLQADVEHMTYVMEEKNYRFGITTLGGSLAKEDRIKKLVPIYEQGRVWWPEKFSYVDYESRSIDLVQSFIDDEYNSFPVSVHDDMLDCHARILDPILGAEFPKLDLPQAGLNAPDHFHGEGSWMA